MSEDENIFDEVERADEKPLVFGEQIQIVSRIWMAAKAKGVLCEEWESNHQRFRQCIGLPKTARDTIQRLDSSKLLSPRNFKWVRR